MNVLAFALAWISILLFIGHALNKTWRGMNLAGFGLAFIAAAWVCQLIWLSTDNQIIFK